MSTPKLTLYFDLLSPFSYVAFHILRVRPLTTSYHDKPPTKLTII